MAMMRLMMVIVCVAFFAMACSDDSSGGGDQEPGRGGVDAGADSGADVSGKADADTEDGADDKDVEAWPPALDAECDRSELRHTFLSGANANTVRVAVPFSYGASNADNQRRYFLRRIDVHSPDYWSIERVRFEMPHEVNFRARGALKNDDSHVFEAGAGPQIAVDRHNALDFDFPSSATEDDLPQGDLQVEIELKEGNNGLGSVKVSAVYRCWN